MKAVFELAVADSPLVISVPHDGALIPEAIQKNMHDYALDTPDRDSGISAVFEFTGFQYSKIKANYSRYVVDLNRPATGGALYAGQNETTVCPTTLFDERPIYLAGQEPRVADVQQRVADYWQPYHDQLQSLVERAVEKFGCCLLIDAHSIDAEVPRFFEGRLSDISVGTFDRKSCGAGIEGLLLNALEQQTNYSHVVNDRFKGGFITRHYGRPESGVHAIQLEHVKDMYAGDRCQDLTDFWQTVIQKLLHLVGA